MKYTPTTDDIRGMVINYQWQRSKDASEVRLPAELTAFASGLFDRWLANHDREVKAQVLEEAANDGEIQDNRPWVEWWLRTRAQQLKEQQ